MLSSLLKGFHVSSFLIGLWLVLIGSTSELFAQGAQNLPEKKAAPQTITPNLSQCTLEISGKSIKSRFIPGGKPDSWTRTIYAGDLTLRISPQEIRCFSDDNGALIWTASVPEELALGLAAEDEQILYFLGFTEVPEWPESKYHCRLMRLAKADGKWLEDLTIRSNIKPGYSERIEYVVASKNGFAVLSSARQTNQPIKARESVDYIVSYFDPGTTTPKWTKSFPSIIEDYFRPSFLFMIAVNPHKQHPGNQPLVLLENEILVCAGEVQDLLNLDRKTGAENWKIERIWEFERSFVEKAFVERSFVDWIFVEPRSRFITMRRVGNLARRAKNTGNLQPNVEPVVGPDIHNSIIGGPIVVEENQSGAVAERTIYVAVSEEKRALYHHISECKVYEIGPEGKVRGVVTLPRPVFGEDCKVLKNGLVWACPNGSLVRVTSAVDKKRDPFDSPPRPDCVVNVDWVSQHRSPENQAWFTMNKAGDCLTLSDRFAFSTPSGGYILESTDQVIHFPIAMADLNTGQFQYMEMKVPFEGKMPDPPSGYPSSQRLNGKPSWKTNSPRPLAIFDLEASKKRLKVTFSGNGGKQVVEFPLDEIIRLRNG